MSDAPPLDTPLLPHETYLRSWQPSLAVFAQRALLLGFATALALGGIGIVSWTQWLISLPILTVLYVFIFDDYRNWIAHRDERWHLTSQRMIFENAQSPEENASIPLSAISRLRLWFWWTLRIGLENGTATSIRYIRNPAEARRRILQAQCAFYGGDQ